MSGGRPRVPIDQAAVQEYLLQGWSDVRMAAALGVTVALLRSRIHEWRQSKRIVVPSRKRGPEPMKGWDEAWKEQYRQWLAENPDANQNTRHAFRARLKRRSGVRRVYRPREQRARDIGILLLYGSGYSYTEIAATVGVTRQAIEQRVKGILEKMEALDPSLSLQTLYESFARRR